MSKKTFALVSAITTGVATIATGLVTFFNPPMVAAWIGAIPLIEGCIIGVCSKFVVDETKAVEKKTSKK